MTPGPRFFRGPCAAGADAPGGCPSPMIRRRSATEATERGSAPMMLYTCSFEKLGGGLPAALAHPCGRAAKALDDAGHTYEIKTVKGGSLRPWTWPSRARDRAEVEQLSSQRSVPILVLDDGEVIAGSASIVGWAQANEPRAGA